MTDDNRHLDDRVRGKTLRWTWTEGPTVGKTHEHVFADDGTVSWRAVGEGAANARPAKNDAAERARYAALAAGDGVCAVSYLAKSGFTLTSVLNFNDNTMVGFASGKDQWFPVRGTFEEER